MQAGSPAAGHGDQGSGMQLMTVTRLLLHSQPALQPVPHACMPTPSLFTPCA